MKKDIRKTIRFSNDEFKIIQDKLDLSNMDFSTFGRNAILNQKLEIPIPKIEKDLLFEINKIGNNLNQIARAVNQKDKIPVLDLLVKIEKELNQLVEKCI